jgi:hypothetical protein
MVKLAFPPTCTVSLDGSIAKDAPAGTTDPTAKTWVAITKPKTVAIVFIRLGLITVLCLIVNHTCSG